MVKPCSRNKNSPLVRLQNKYERYGTENNVLSGRGLARRPLSARRVHIKMTSHVAQCIHNTSYCAARELCRLQIWTKRYREHFTVLVIWTLVYREHVPRTFCQGFVPRTYMNGLLVFLEHLSNPPCLVGICLRVAPSLCNYRHLIRAYAFAFPRAPKIHFINTSVVLYHYACKSIP